MIRFFQVCVFALISQSVIATSQLLAQAGPREIQVGVVVPLTGDWATWGDRIRRGLEMYADEHKESVHWNFTFEDEATCDAQKALSGYKAIRLKTKAKIFVLGCMNGARVIAPVAKSEGTLLLSAGFEQEEVFKIGAMLVNLALQVDSEAKKLGGAIELAGIKKLGILRNAGVEDFLRGMESRWNGKVAIANDTVLQASDLDFAGSLLKMKNSGIDGLFLNLGEYQLSSALRRIKELGFKVPVFTSYGTDSLARSNATLLTIAEGVKFSHPSVAATGSEMQKRFEARFKSAPSVNSLFVYDGMMLLESYLPACNGGEDTRCLFEKIANDLPRDGIAGPYTIHKDGSITREFELRTIRGGKIVTEIEKLPG